MSKKNIFSSNDTGATQTAAPTPDTAPATPAQEQAQPETTAPQDQAPVPAKANVKEIKNPQRVIDANLVNAVKLFASTDETRYVISGICFTTDENGKPVAVATDGRKIAIADQLVVDADDYPAFPNGYGQDTKDEIIVPIKPLMEALRKVPKRTTLPILQTPPLISLRNDKGEATQACIPVTDLDTHSIETTKAIDGRFPNYRQVIPPADRTAIEIVLDANILLDLAQAAIAFTKNGSTHMVPIKLCIPFESTHPVKAEVKDQCGRKLTMVTMPLKDDGELINRIDHTALHQVTERLATIADRFDETGRRNPRQGKEQAQDAKAA